MALKYIITKKEFEKLSDDMKDNYELNGDGKGYTLDVSDLPEPEDNGALVRARDREKERADNAEEELKEVQDELKKVTDGQSSGEKDVARVKTRYQQKITDAENAGKERADKLREKFANEKINGMATTLANKISTAPAVFAETVAKRLVAEWDDEDNLTIKVLDKDNKPAVLKLEDFEKELVANPAYAGIIKGSRASGSGAPTTALPLNPSSAGTEKPVDLAKASRTDLKAAVGAKIAEKAAAGA